MKSYCGAIRALCAARADDLKHRCTATGEGPVDEAATHEGSTDDPATDEALTAEPADVAAEAAAHMTDTTHTADTATAKAAHVATAKAATNNRVTG